MKIQENLGSHAGHKIGNFIACSTLYCPTDHESKTQHLFEWQDKNNWHLVQTLSNARFMHDNTQIFTP